MKRLVLSVAVVAALAVAAAPGSAQEPCGGVLQPPCPTPTPSVEPTATPTPTPMPQPRLRVSLRVKPAAIQSGGRVKLTGRVHGLRDAEGVEVQVLARVGDGEYRVERPTYTDDRRGRFVLYPQPGLTTTYRAQVGIARNAPRRVIAFPAVYVDATPVNRGARISAAIEVSHFDSPRPEIGRGTRGHFYVRLTGDPVLRRIGKAPVSGMGCEGGSCSRYSRFVVRDPAVLARLRSVAVCFSGQPFRDAGVAVRCRPAGRSGELAIAR